MRDRIRLAGVGTDVGHCESCAFQDKDRQWQEYLDFGPHGLSVIRNSGAHRLRRAGWLCFMLMGLYLCSSHMYMNIQKYLEFKSQERPSINKKHEITFPKVTICLNSMHSKKKLKEWPSGKSYVTTEELIEYYYLGGEQVRRGLGIFDTLDTYDMDDFHNQTAATFGIEYCQFGPMDCKHLWMPIMTYFGRCLQFSSFELGKQLAAYGKREIQMSVLASYNTSDWTHGWVSMMEGFSIFVNSEMEETLDDALTLLSGDKSLMQVEIRQENRKLMGAPFTPCEDPNLTLLNHYAIYGRKNCLSECMVNHIEQYCACRPAIFPPFLPIDFTQYNQKTRLKFNRQGKRARVCSFSQHAYCASPLMRNFTYNSCHCEPSCLSVHFSVENIIYGSWRQPLSQMTNQPDISVGSFMIRGNIQVV